MNTPTKVLLSGALLACTALADNFTLLSGDATTNPTAYSSQGAISLVQPIPASECPYCWADIGAPYVSINPSYGWGNGGSAVPLGWYSIYQPLTLTSATTLSIVASGDDSVETYWSRDLAGGRTLTTDLGYGDFATPLKTQLQAIAGNYLLEFRVMNSHAWPAGTGNYSAVAYLLQGADLTRTPEPGTVGLFLSGGALIFVGMRRRK